MRRKSRFYKRGWGRTSSCREQYTPKIYYDSLVSEDEDGALALHEAEIYIADDWSAISTNETGLGADNNEKDVKYNIII